MVRKTRMRSKRNKVGYRVSRKRTKKASRKRTKKASRKRTKKASRRKRKIGGRNVVGGGKSLCEGLPQRTHYQLNDDAGNARVTNNPEHILELLKMMAGNMKFIDLIAAGRLVGRNGEPPWMSDNMENIINGIVKKESGGRWTKNKTSSDEKTFYDHIMQVFLSYSFPRDMSKLMIDCNAFGDDGTHICGKNVHFKQSPPRGAADVLKQIAQAVVDVWRDPRFAQQDRSKIMDDNKTCTDLNTNWNSILHVKALGEEQVLSPRDAGRVEQTRRRVSQRSLNA